MEVFGQESNAELIEGRANGDNLLKDLTASATLVDHFLKAVHLTRNPGKSSLGIGLYL